MPMPPTPAGTRQTISEEALPHEGAASPDVVRVGGEPHMWGGPRIRWAKRKNPESAFSVLDDKEARDWGTL
jgi:hypothetical protein